MSTRGFLLSLFFGTALSVLPGCASHTEQPPSAIQEETLTPERARGALLEMMRSKPGQEFGWFQGNIPNEMAKQAIEEGEDGCYKWSGAFRFHPGKAIYTFVVRPQPGTRACTLVYQCSFQTKDGRWSATVPELVSTALEAGE